MRSEGSRLAGLLPSALKRFFYSPFLAHLIVIRRCNLSCAYCNEYDHSSQPIPAAVLEKRLLKLRELGTFGICLTGGEPTLHPDLPHLIQKCRDLRFFRVGLITNGFTLKPELIHKFNGAGLHEMQISIDGVQENRATRKVLDNLKEGLDCLHRHADFEVVVSGVIGSCPAEEVLEVISYTRSLGFIPRVLLVHDETGSLKLTADEAQVFKEIIQQIPRSWRDFTRYRETLVRNGQAPFKCRAGSRYLYVDEDGLVSWCSQTRSYWSKPLAKYGFSDLAEQFYAYKDCHGSCTLGCVRSCSQLDGWRSQREH